ncbi:PEGA domain-containing protein [Candidatus Bipolaricaulota bacterium]|nr:PEGA domain-containing protein [Candidatus Bipolaricaulota bacterium]
MEHHQRGRSPQSGHLLTIFSICIFLFASLPLSGCFHTPFSEDHLLWSEDFENLDLAEYNYIESGCWKLDSSYETLILSTQDEPYCVSRFFNPTNWDLNRFELQFDYRASASDGWQADGLTVAFVANSAYEPIGSNAVVGSGGWLGFEGAEGFAIEIDLYPNSPYDPSITPHIAVIQDSVKNHVEFAPAEQLIDGQWHRFSIVFDEGYVIVFVDGDEILSTRLQTSRSFLGNIGFTAATGGFAVQQEIDNVALFDKHSILIETASVQVSSTPVGARVYVDGLHTGQQTPCTVNCDLPLATSIIGLGLDGYAYLEKSSIAGSIHADLQPLSGLLPNASDWRILLLFVETTRVTYERSDGTTVTASATLPQELIQATIDVIPAWFEETLANYTLGTAQASLETAITSMPVTSISQFGSLDDSFWVSPDDVEDMLDIYAPVGKYDGVLLYWPCGTIPTSYWGCAVPPSTASNGTGFALVAYSGGAYPDWRGNQEHREVWLHEWLHTIEAHFASAGFILPSQGADGGGSHGYMNGHQLSGWSLFYRDFVTGSVPQGSIHTGIPPSAWLRTETIREKALRSL